MPYPDALLDEREATLGNPAATHDLRIRLVPTRANRQPAVALYRLNPDGRSYRAIGFLVLAVEGDAIAELVGFTDPTLFPSFGLPMELDMEVAIRSHPKGAPLRRGCGLRRLEMPPGNRQA